MSTAVPAPGVTLVLSHDSVVGAAVARVLEADGATVHHATPTAAGWTVDGAEGVAIEALVDALEQRDPVDALVAIAAPRPPQVPTAGTVDPLDGFAVGRPAAGPGDDAGPGGPLGDVGWIAAATRRAAGPMARRGRGRVVVVASTAGRRGDAGAPMAAVAHAALHGLVRSLARALGPTGVTANAVVHALDERPDTEDHEPTDERGSAGGRGRRGRGFAARTGDRPLARAATPDDVAHAVAFLLSADAGYVTGATVPVDAGASIGYG